jgi:hypothetical protein
MRAPKASKPKDIIHQWGEISRYDRSDTVNGATSAGSAGDAVTVTVDNGGMWRADDTFISLTNATDTGAANIYWIESITGNDLSVRVLPVSTKTNPYAGDSFGTVPAFADAETLYWIGNAKEQAFTMSGSRILQPAYQFNFVQTFDQVIKWADHKNYQENFTQDDVRRYRRDNLFEFRKNLEYSALFNRAPAKVADPTSSELRHTMGGAWHYASSTTVTLQNTGGVPSEAQGVDFIYAVFDDNNGSATKTLFGGKTLMKAIDKINTSDLQTKRSEKVAGVRVLVMEGRIGRLVTAYTPGFDETGRSAAGLVVDMPHVSWREFAPMERRVLDLKGQGTDADGEYWTVKACLEMRNAETHKRVALA